MSSGSQSCPIQVPPEATGKLHTWLSQTAEGGAWYSSPSCLIPPDAPLFVAYTCTTCHLPPPSFPAFSKQILVAPKLSFSLAEPVTKPRFGTPVEYPLTERTVTDLPLVEIPAGNHALSTPPGHTLSLGTYLLLDHYEDGPATLFTGRPERFYRFRYLRRHQVLRLLSQRSFWACRITASVVLQ